MGFFLGLFSSATFGLIPLFTIPLLRGGLSPEATLFYRFLFASTALGALLLMRHECLRVPRGELLKLAGMSLFYTLAALLLFQGLVYLPGGIAATIQFLYPVMVMLIMIGFFHERFSWLTALSIILATVGVALLSMSDAETQINLYGVVLLLISALCNAVYIVGIHVARIKSINGLTMTFYLLFFGAIYTGLNTTVTGTFRLIQSWYELLLLILLALITAVLSNLTLVLAVRLIGSTLASVLGVMEPLTAVLVGVLVFHEAFTPVIATGVFLISISVVILMLAPQIQRWLGTFRKNVESVSK